MACLKSSNYTDVTIECETYTSYTDSLANTHKELNSTVSNDKDNVMVKLKSDNVDNNKHEDTTLTNNADEIYDDAVSPKIDDIKQEDIALTNNADEIYDDAVSPKIDDIKQEDIALTNTDDEIYDIVLDDNVSPKIDDDNHENNTSSSENTYDSQSNTDANTNTNGTKQTPNIKTSKSCVFVLIVVMVMIAIGSSAITALILKQEFRSDLKSIRDELESISLNGSKDSDRNWSSWLDWGDCSITCNVGVRTRNRSCDTFDNISRGTCSGNDVDMYTCNNGLCLESSWSSWADWGNCSATCNAGIRTRKRTCVSSDIDRSRGICSGNDVDISTCNNAFCIERSWNTWSDWGDCSVTCNVGVRTRNRSCDTSDIDRPRGSCVGNDVDISTCNNAHCQANLNELQQRIQFGGSSTYVRWGSGNCPANGTDLVYWGYAGGSHYSHSGGAVNYICLPQDPDWGYYEDALQNGGFVYGAEYEYNYRASSAKFFELHATSISNKDAPCAVCRSTRSSVLMIPGKNRCHSGWTKEYDGYLSAGSFLHAAGSEYVCVDKYAAVLSGGQGRDDNGVLFYFVEGRCGSLKCPPYVNGRELTCVVCTK